MEYLNVVEAMKDMMAGYSYSNEDLDDVGMINHAFSNSDTVVCTVCEFPDCVPKYHVNLYAELMADGRAYFAAIGFCGSFGVDLTLFDEDGGEFEKYDSAYLDGRKYKPLMKAVQEWDGKDVGIMQPVVQGYLDAISYNNTDEQEEFLALCDERSVSKNPDIHVNGEEIEYIINDGVNAVVIHRNEQAVHIMPMIALPDGVVMEAA